MAAIRPRFIGIRPSIRIIDILIDPTRALEIVEDKISFLKSIGTLDLTFKALADRHINTPYATDKGRVINANSALTKASRIPDNTLIKKVPTEPIIRKPNISRVTCTKISNNLS